MPAGFVLPWSPFRTHTCLFQFLGTVPRWRSPTRLSSHERLASLAVKRVVFISWETKRTVSVPKQSSPVVLPRRRVRQPLWPVACWPEAR